MNTNWSNNDFRKYVADIAAFLRESESELPPKRRAISPLYRFVGIGQFSEQNGVTREHVYRVLAGKRESRKIVEAWKNFTAGRSA